MSLTYITKEKRGEAMDDSIEKLYRENYEYVYQFILRMCGDIHIAEEIASETFYKAINKINSYDGTCKIRTWLCQIAKNTYFSYYKKHKHLTEYTESNRTEQTEHNSIEELLIKKENIVRIHCLLHQMDEPYKEVFSLRIFAELSFAEIGQVFGKTENWARVTYHRSKLKLIAKLG